MKHLRKLLVVAHVVVAVVLCWPSSWGFSPSASTWLWLGAWAVVCVLRVPIGLTFYSRYHADREELSWRMAVAGIIAGPIAEEIIFRGALQSAIGIVPAAIVFGLAHHDDLDGDLPTHSTVSAAIGLLLGCLAQEHGLWFSLVAHMMFNAGSVVARVLTDRESAREASSSVAELPSFDPYAEAPDLAAQLGGVRVGDDLEGMISGELGIHRFRVTTIMLSGDLHLRVLDPVSGDIDEDRPALIPGEYIIFGRVVP